MIKNFSILLCFISVVFAQLGNQQLKLSNQQLDEIKAKLQSDTKASTVEDMPKLTLDESSPVSITSTAVTIATEDYFGYNYLRKDISFFDNTPTPADYRLGPGDEIVISLWGENNSRRALTINKDGMIFYNNIGFINLSNHTLESAELMLIEELSRIYSTLKDEDNPTQLMLSLGKLKSMNIYFSGQIENPGINLVHPFSDIFAAIIQAGGVSKNGSLREVQLIRNDTIIAKVDFYTFFMDGKNNFSSIKLIDSDVIHIPTIKKRVSISGEVNRPSSYELLNNETLIDLVNYASGFTSNASSNLIIEQIIPLEERISDDNARASIVKNFQNAQSLTLNNGDSINVLPIANVRSKVQVFGRVKNPGVYPATNMSLKEILDVAGGFDDPVYRKSINEEVIILRKDQNNFYAKEIDILYEDAGDFKLFVDDKILVYENVDYNNSFTYRIEGEVNKPGTYFFGSTDLTVKKAIELAGGLTERGSESNLIIEQAFTFIDDDGNTVTDIELLKNVSIDFKIGINSIITATPIENVVRVEGNVYNPGLIAFNSEIRLPRYITLAGGFKPDTMKNKIYIQRTNGKIEKVSRLYGKKVYAGDIITVPVNPNPPADFDTAAFTADILGILTNIAAILLVVDNQK